MQIRKMVKNYSFPAKHDKLFLKKIISRASLRVDIKLSVLLFTLDCLLSQIRKNRCCLGVTLLLPAGFEYRFKSCGLAYFESKKKFKKKFKIFQKIDEILKKKFLNPRHGSKMASRILLNGSSVLLWLNFWVPNIIWQSWKTIHKIR